MVYLYEGEFDGFLTCIYRHYYEEAAEGIYEAKVYEPRLLEEAVYIKTNHEEADCVHKAMISKFSEEMYSNLYNTFLSNEYEKDTLLLNYLKVAFKHGRNTDRMRSVDQVYAVQKIGRQVGSEQHRFLGLLRFSDLGEYLYAKFEPDHNIVTLLAEHFADRFRDEKFVIHDVKRSIAVIGYEGRWLLTDFNQVIDEEVLGEEVFFRALWQEYFDKIGIEGRKNVLLQQSFVPLKYRKHIVEFQELQKRQAYVEASRARITNQ